MKWKMEYLVKTDDRRKQMLLGGEDSLRRDGFHGLWQEEERV